MSDIDDNAMNPAPSDDLGPRINTVRELIRLLVIAPIAHPDDELPETPATLLHLSRRLGRLLAQAGMTDCVRAAATLERASADLPSDDSLRDIDAVLVYLRARLLNVALPGAHAATTSAASNVAANTTADDAAITPDTAGNTNAATDVATTASATSDDMPGQSQPANASDANVAADVAAEAEEAGAYETVDESQYSTKTQAVIRKFKNATLRQRAPGEITMEPHQPVREISNVIPEHMKHEFLGEAAGDLSDLRAAIASFGKMPGSLDDLREMARLGHKVKGTADTYLFPVLAKVLHCFEAVPRVLQPVAVSRSAACLNLLIRFTDVIAVALDEAGEQGEASEDRLVEAQFLLAEAHDLAATQHMPAAASMVGTGEFPAVATHAAEPVSERSTIHLPSVYRGGDEDSLLRVEPRQLDSLMHQSDGLAMNRAMLAQTSEEIHHVQSEIDQVLGRLAVLSAQLTDLHPLIRRTGEASQTSGSGPRWLVRRETGIGTWDDLELDSFTIFDEALRALSETALDASTLSSALHSYIQRLTRNSDAQRSVLHSMQQTIIHMRLVSLKSLADRVLLAAYQVAQNVDKQVEISILGQDTEIDRNISDALIAPILQLVRNAVAHGIESPAERVAHGKPPAGKIWLHASYSGNEVSIELGDDGRGVNPHQLIAAAVAARIIEAKPADYLTRDQALALMFEPNLSTNDQVGVIAGHGIGLDSVVTAIQRLRGSITARSVQGQGTVFQIRVPISLSITRALHVRVANNEYAIPFSLIRQMFAVPEAGILVSLPDAESRNITARFPRRVRVARPTSEQPLRRPDDPNAALYDEVPVFSLAELLGQEELPRETHMALLLDVGQRQVAILVDEVLDESEVVIRALPAHLRRQAVRGASIMSDGRLFLVLDVADLLADALGGKTATRPPSQPKLEQAHQRVPRVLVVDDSISMRRAVEGTLASVGYDVQVARDGVEALGMMLADLPDAMILDIEMPRLDGFELLSVINGNEALARVPVVILTSRAAEKHHRHALELGVRGYLTKPCPDDVLLTTLQRVLREPEKSL